MADETLPLDDNGRNVTGLYDPVSHRVVAEQAGTVQVDPVTGKSYAPESILVGNFPTEQSVNLNQVNGSPLSTGNPVPVELAGGPNGSFGNNFWVFLEGSVSGKGLDVNVDHSLPISDGGQQTTGIAAAAASTIIKNAAGRLCRVLVTAAGSAALTFYDNSAGTATGTIIGIVPSSATLGQIFDFQFPAASGISAVGGTGSPAVTVSFN